NAYCWFHKTRQGKPCRFGSGIQILFSKTTPPVVPFLFEKKQETLFWTESVFVCPKAFFQKDPVKRRASQSQKARLRSALSALLKCIQNKNQADSPGMY